MLSHEKTRFYYLPKALTEQASVIHASCYRLALSMLRRADHEPVPVPVNSLDYTALLTDEDVFFADNQATETRHGETGSLIRLSWHLHLAEARDITVQHIPMKVVYYHHEMEKLQQQMTGEFYKALMLMDKQYGDRLIPSGNIHIKQE